MQTHDILQFILVVLLVWGGYIPPTLFYLFLKESEMAKNDLVFKKKIVATKAEAFLEVVVANFKDQNKDVRLIMGKFGSASQINPDGASDLVMVVSASLSIEQVGEGGIRQGDIHFEMYSSGRMEVVISRGEVEERISVSTDSAGYLLFTGYDRERSVEVLGDVIKRVFDLPVSTRPSAPSPNPKEHRPSA